MQTHIMTSSHAGLGPENEARKGFYYIIGCYANARIDYEIKITIEKEFSHGKQ